MQGLTILKFRKIKLTTFLNELRIFPCGELKRNATKAAEEYCWAITQVTGRLCWARSGFCVLEFAFQLNWIMYVSDHTCTHFRFAPGLPQRCYCVNRGVTVRN